MNTFHREYYHMEAIFQTTTGGVENQLEIDDISGESISKSVSLACLEVIKYELDHFDAFEGSTKFHVTLLTQYSHSLLCMGQPLNCQKYKCPRYKPRQHATGVVGGPLVAQQWQPPAPVCQQWPTRGVLSGRFCMFIMRHQLGSVSYRWQHYCKGPTDLNPK